MSALSYHTCSGSKCVKYKTIWLPHWCLFLTNVYTDQNGHLLLSVHIAACSSYMLQEG